VSQRPTPIEELVNALEFEEAARRALAPAVFSTIAGSERAALDRVTFRPRMNVPRLDLDISVELFGQPHFAPIVVGPISEQRRFHAEGELATARGAAAANAAMVIASHSSAPITDIAAAHKGPLWYAVYADDLAAGVGGVASGMPGGNGRLQGTVYRDREGRRRRPPANTHARQLGCDRSRAQDGKRADRDQRHRRRSRRPGSPRSRRARACRLEPRHVRPFVD
jgi:isopentenyl diphosphate isomerase/L-lactate dehydrogenase-like FMN-dependent dehydrogenase